MTEIPELCPLPKDAFERQRALLGVHVASELHRSPRRRWRLAAIAVAIVAGAALLVTPAFGIGDRLLALIEGAPARPEVQSPVWSPDGRRIAFVSRRDGKALYVMNADGSGLRIVARVERLATLPGRPTGGGSPSEAERRQRLRRERRRKRAADVGAQGKRSCLVARRPANRFRDHRQALRRERRRKRAPDSDAAEGTGRAASLAWSPDGRKLLFLRSTAPPPAAPTATASMS